MKRITKYFLIMCACALIGVAIFGRNMFNSSDTELYSLDEQYSDSELLIYETAYDKCVNDIMLSHPDTKPHIIVLTCQCTAKRVLRATINPDGVNLNTIYSESKNKCYKVSITHLS